MSYCRFSTDDYNCDLYIHGISEGYRLYVASGRYQGDIPKASHLIPWAKGKATSESVHAYFVAHRAQMDFLSTAELSKIDHPLAGTMHDIATAEELVALLRRLAEEGFRMPAWLIARIEDETLDDESGLQPCTEEP